MKRGHILGVGLVALLALFAMTASSALAASEWQSDGTTIGTALDATTKGLLELVNLVEAGSTTKLVSADCEGILDGTVGPGARDEITKILSTAGVEIGSLSSGEKLNCTVTQTAGGLADCAATGELMTAVPVGLPWKTELELMSTAPKVLELFLSGGYEIECKTPVGTLMQTCEGQTSDEVKNVTGGVESVFSSEPPIDSEASNCTLTGTGTGLLQGSGTTALENGLALTVSE